MNIIFRTDCSTAIGTGHVMRCLTLAEKLRSRGAKISFISRTNEGNLIDWIQSIKDFRVYALPLDTNHHPCNENKPAHHIMPGAWWEEDALQVRTVLKKEGVVQWLVVDHYELDFRWEQAMRPFVKNIMVIDDLADRRHDCDLLLDQNLCENIESRYDNLTPGYCRKFIGPQYALLRDEFISARKRLRDRDGYVRRVLVFFGGSDPTNETVKTLEALRMLKREDLFTDVVVGRSNPYKVQVELICSTLPNSTFFCQVDHMADLMARADLAIGAGGATTWERCLLGLPAITIVVAQNQLEPSACVAAAGAAWTLGSSTGVSVKYLAEAIKKAMDNPLEMKEMGKKATHLMGNRFLEKEDPLLEAIMEGGHAGA